MAKDMYETAQDEWLSGYLKGSYDEYGNPVKPITDEWNWEQGKRVPIGQTMQAINNATPTKRLSFDTPTPFYRSYSSAQPRDVQTDINQFYGRNPIPKMTIIAPPVFKTSAGYESQIRKEQQTQAAPVISKLRQAIRQGYSIAANEDNPTRRKMMLRALMEGSGSAISGALATGYESARGKVSEDINRENQATMLDYQTKANQAMRQDAARLGAWQASLLQILSGD